MKTTLSVFGLSIALAVFQMPSAPAFAGEQPPQHQAPAGDPPFVSLEELKKLKEEMGKKAAIAAEAKKAYEDALAAYTEPCAKVVDPVTGQPSNSHADFEKRAKALALDQWKDTKKDMADGFAKWAPGKPDPDYFPWKIRRSVLSAEDLDDAAAFTWVNNFNDSSDSFSIDAAFMLDPALPGYLTDSQKPYELAPFVEYHRNTASSALNDTLITGIYFNATHVSDDNLITDFVEHLNFIGGFRRDKFNEGDSIFGRLEWAPTTRCIPLPKVFFHDKEYQARLRVAPSVAIDWRHTYDGINPAVEGDNAILHAGADLQYLPAYLSKRLVVKAGYDFWRYLSKTDSNAFPDDNLNYFRASADFYIDGTIPGDGDPVTGSNGHFAVSLIYTHGDNPDTGAIDEDQLSLSFRVFY